MTTLGGIHTAAALASLAMGAAVLLIAAAVAEVTTRVPGITFWWTVVLASLAVFAIGAPIIKRRARVTTAPVLPSARAP